MLGGLALASVIAVSHPLAWLPHTERLVGAARPAPPAVETALLSCGSRGGPGWRGPDGRCVGRRNLNRVCGVPAETRCKAEGATGFATGGALGGRERKKP